MQQIQQECSTVPTECAPIYMIPNLNLCTFKRYRVCALCVRASSRWIYFECDFHVQILFFFPPFMWFLPQKSWPSAQHVAHGTTFHFLFLLLNAIWREIFTYYFGDERDAYNVVVTVHIYFFAWRDMELLLKTISNLDFPTIKKNKMQNRLKAETFLLFGCPQSIFNMILIDKVQFGVRTMCTVHTHTLGGSE